MILHGDCLDEMKKMADNSISAIVTDPPYGLHFMGKDWDKFGRVENQNRYDKPNVKCSMRSCEAGQYDDRRNDEFQSFIYQFSLEAIRILKPGGHVLMFGAPRRYHRQVSGLEDAGFEIRDCLMWLFGSGFPKSHNHFGIEGFGTALKPAHEPIIMAMKPCDGTFKQNAEKWGQAGINIDGCRIGFQSEKEAQKHAEEWDRNWTTTPIHAFDKAIGNHPGAKKEIGDGPKPQKGRWPANVIFDEEAAKMLDAQQETVSRFFYCAKTSSRERNEGLEGMPDQVGGGMCSTVSGDTRTGHITIQKNNHPTVKPLKLMRYLITLIMPPKDGILLDPFAGSGSTIIAAHQLGVKAIGIEKQAEYVKIAKKRLEYYKSFQDEKEPDLFDKAMNQ